MNMQEDLDIIDKYILKSLSESDRILFNEKLRDDKAFKETYEFVLSVRNASLIVEENRIKKMLINVPIDDFPESVINSQEANATSNRETPIIHLKTTFILTSVAAAFALIFLFWQPFKISNKELYSEYLSTAKAIPLISTNQLNNIEQNRKFEEGKLDEKGQQNSKLQNLNETKETSELRGVELIFNNYTRVVTESLYNAIDLLNEGKYDNAKRELLGLTSKENKPEMLIFLAIAQLKTNEVDAAISNLEFLYRNVKINKDIQNEIDSLPKFIDYPNVVRNTNGNQTIKRIEREGELIKIDFVYHAYNDFINGGWVSIQPDCFIRKTGTEKKEYLLKAIGIPIDPEKLYFQTNMDSLNYTLYFPSLPINTQFIDIIESEAASDSLMSYFNFYQVAIPFIKREISFTPFEDEIKYHLAMGYIKVDKIKEARSLLNSLVEKNSKYSNDAKFYLQKMRWF